MIRNNSVAIAFGCLFACAAAPGPVMAAPLGLYSMIGMAIPAVCDSPGDNCANAIVVGPGVTGGSTVGLCPEGSSSCAATSASPDLWYSYTPASDGTLTADLCSSLPIWDSVISVHTGCPGTGESELACNDDACGAGGPAFVSLSVTANQTYYIRVSGWGSGGGNADLDVTGPPAASVDVPTLSEWGVATMTLLLLIAGTIVLGPMRKKGSHKRLRGAG